MNVDGVVAFSPLLFWQKPTGRSRCLFFWQQIYKWFSLRIWEDVCCMYRIVTSFKKIIKMLLSNCFSTDFPHALYFESWRCKLMQCFYMPSVHVFENMTFCSLFTNRLRSFRDFNHHTVTSINHLFLCSSETWDAALSILSLSVFRACNNFCVCLWQF